jgi:hypothetical protein
LRRFRLQNVREKGCAARAHRAENGRVRFQDIAAATSIRTRILNFEPIN